MLKFAHSLKEAIYEINPVLDLPRDELESFASAVTGRFVTRTSSINCLSIALNGV